MDILVRIESFYAACAIVDLVTLKDLKKLVQSQSSLEQSQLSQKLKDKPFWVWDQQQHKREDIRTKGLLQRGLHKMVKQIKADTIEAHSESNQDMVDPVLGRTN